MSHQDKLANHESHTAEFLRQALAWLLQGIGFSEIQFRDDCTWLPRQLVAVALVWAWSNEDTLGERFTAARRIIDFLERPQHSFAGSRQAFDKLLARWTTPLRNLLQAAFRQRMQTALGSQWLVHGWLVFGTDGSRVEVPRTRAHEALAKRPVKQQRKTRRRKSRRAADTKKGQTPYVWLTLLWHVGTGLPWSWRSGPPGSSEREHCCEMLEELPANALLTGDAGFTGFDFLQTILAGGRHVLVRVGSNVRLLRKLGFARRESAGTVYLWPECSARHQPPLVLRLVVVQGPRHPLYLVTDLPASQLSDRHVGDLYYRRWGIELFFRHFKQTFQRRKLRSATPEPARVELEWSLLSLWGLTLHAQFVLQQQGLPPARLSVAGVLRVMRRVLRDYLHPLPRGGQWNKLLRSALRDEYPRRNKTSRDYPRKKQPKPPRPPEILTATAAEIRQAHKLRLAA